MMTTTLLLAKAFGIYLLILSIAMMWHKDRFLAALHDMVNSPSVSLISAIFTMIIGILLILSHNVWVSSWPVVITVLCWAVFIKGTIRVLFPAFDKMAVDAVSGNKILCVASVIMLLVGLWLIYQGFFNAV